MLDLNALSAYLQRFRIAQEAYGAAVEAFEALPHSGLPVDRARQFITRHAEPGTRLHWLMSLRSRMEPRGLASATRSVLDPRRGRSCVVESASGHSWRTRSRDRNDYPGGVGSLRCSARSGYSVPGMFLSSAWRWYLLVARRGSCPALRLLQRVRRIRSRARHSDGSEREHLRCTPRW